MSGPTIDRFDFNDCEFVTDASEARRYQQALLVEIQNRAPSVIRELREITSLYNPKKDEDGSENQNEYVCRTIKWCYKYGLTDQQGYISQWVNDLLDQTLCYWHDKST